MKVTKRNGEFEDVKFDKITARIARLASGLKVDSVIVAQKVCTQIVDLIPTSQLDELAAQNCMSMYVLHPDYTVLGSRIVISNHHKNTSESFAEVTKACAALLDPEYVACVLRNSDHLQAMIDSDRDFLFDYFGFKTLTKSYLLKSVADVIAERPQHMWMRVAVFLHGDNLEKVQETYDLMSQKFFTHASPTLFNAGTTRPQLSSCFVAGTTVMTLGRGPVAIEDVQLGEQVLTHLCRFKPVIQKHANPLENRNLYRIAAYHTKPFVVTDNHPMFVYSSATLTTGWKRVDELVAGSDYLCIPSLAASTDMESGFSFNSIIRNYVFADKRLLGYKKWTEHQQSPRGAVFAAASNDMTPEIAWICGVIARYASVAYEYVGGEEVNLTQLQRVKGATLNFSAHLSPTDQHRLEFAIEQQFGVSASEIAFENKTMTVDNVFFGIVAEEISRIPKEFFRLKTPLVHKWFRGFMFLSENEDDDVVIDMSRYTLQFKERLYHWLKCHSLDIGYPTQTMEVNLFTSSVSDTGTRLNTRCRKVDARMFVAVESITSEDAICETVYTLGVDEDHSYSVHGVCAQNCFLTNVDDSVEGIFKTLGDCAQISKWAGGLGVNISNIRGNNSMIRGTNGISSGIMPLLKTYNAVGRYINQCFVPSTILYTFDGPKYIEDIAPDVDMVLTHDGSFKTVKTVFSRDCPLQELVEIRNAYTLESVKCTIQHQLWVSKDKGQTMQYVSADEVTAGNYMYFPWPAPVTDGSIPAIDPQVCRFYALHYLLGYFNHKTNTWSLNVHVKFEQTIAFLDRMVAAPTQDSSPPTSAKEYRSYTYTRDDVDIPANTWDAYFDAKQFHPHMIHQPRESLTHVLTGLLETRVDLSTNRNKVFNIFFMYKDRFLIEAIKFMFMKLHVLVHGNFVDVFNAYIINIPIHPNIEDLCRMLCINNAVYITHHVSWIDSPTDRCGALVEVKSVDRVAYEGKVYDLKVDKNHNYTTHMGLVHNSGKRLGSFAMYIEPWHADILDFLNAKKAQGAEEERARDLFYGLWIPDLFMQRVKANDVWSLMCPDACPGLTTCYGSDFDDLYARYEADRKYVRQLPARKIWDAIIESQIESGSPYMLYKDSVNRKNPQENIGVIQQSNLCTEIVLYTDSDHVSVCNLASVALPSFVGEDSEFDFGKLARVVAVVTRNLNRVIDLNFYPIPEARSTNLKHRPIGIGVQGLADVFAMLHLAFDEPAARELNRKIFRTIYLAALAESCRLAKTDGAYECFQGSPMSRGILQYDMWGVKVDDDDAKLKQDIMTHGLRNSTLVAPMPTASTSQILGFNECLVGDTRVTSVHGIAYPLETVRPMLSILSYDEAVGKSVMSTVGEFLDKNMQDVVTLTLLDGRVVECTSNHRFYVTHMKTGQKMWMEAEQLTVDYGIVMGMRGIDDIFEDPASGIPVGIPAQNLAAAMALVRLVAGIVAGRDSDITMSPRQARMRTQTLFDAHLVMDDVHLLNHEKDNCMISLTETGFEVIIGEVVTDYILQVVGSSGRAVPSVFLDPSCPRALVREFVATYCGMDADSTGPYLAWNASKNRSELDGCAMPNRQIGLLVGRLGIAVSGSRISDRKSYVRYIGYRYNINKMLQADAARTYYDYVDTIVSQRQAILQYAFGLEKPPTHETLREAIESTDCIIHELAIPSLADFKNTVLTRTMNDVAVDVCPESFLTQLGLLDWAKGKPVDMVKLSVPTYVMQCVASMPSPEPKHVYDINVPGTHAFIANGCVVHNCIEPFTSNLYARRTLAGEFACINKYLIRDLMGAGVWSQSIMEQLLYHNGSVQYISEIPSDLKNIYRTVWEIKQKSLIEMAADRGPFICQSQSLNLFFSEPSYTKITSAHFLGWKLGLKTGMYYLRSNSAIDAQKVTIDPEREKSYCERRKNADGSVCVSCSG